MLSSAAALLLSLSFAQNEAPAAAVDSAAAAQAAPPAEAPRARWIKQRVSLLYKAADGGIENEIPLTHSEETGGARMTVHDVSGEVSSNGRFAYAFEKNDLWNTSKTKLIERRRVLRVYGSDGRLLWENPAADAPEGQAPLLFSADGETAVVLSRRDKGWMASVRDYLGAPLIEIGPYPKIDAAFLTANGRYALVRWLIPDQDSGHTFLDVKNKARKDIASGDLYMGQARIDEDGKVFSNKKLVFDFAAAPAEEKKP